jgi:hypothetical protein
MEEKEDPQNYHDTSTLRISILICMLICTCIVYYETIKRKLKRRLIYECRCDERLKAKTEGSKRHAYTGLQYISTYAYYIYLHVWPGSVSS